MDPSASPLRLEAHVAKLAGEIGERNVFRPAALDAARRYIEEQWREQSYEVTSQTYMARGVESANLEVTGPKGAPAGEILLIGAHYDSVLGSPGANDNASGVAALLELSRLFGDAQPKRECTLRFVAFVNEEPPFFNWGKMGSTLYARAARRRGDRIRLMISLETIGCYSEEPGSQGYPPVFGWFYPSRGNFVAFVSNLRSRRMMRRAAAAFRSHSDFPLEHVATLAIVPGVSWSDHRSFWKQGYRALMVTDTAFYRYPYYHTTQDTPDRVDYRALARLTDGLYGMLVSLAGPASGARGSTR